MIRFILQLLSFRLGRNPSECSHIYLKNKERFRPSRNDRRDFPDRIIRLIVFASVESAREENKFRMTFPSTFDFSVTSYEYLLTSANMEIKIYL